MITKEEMKKFIDWPSVSKSRVLSVYLKIEPSGEGAIHRTFETTFHALMQSLRKEAKTFEVNDLKKSEERIHAVISNYDPAGQSLVLFADDAAGFFWAKELKIHLVSQVHWLEKPYILPLLEAFDEYERYGVVLADKTRARIFTFCLGEIEEEKAAIAWNGVQHIQTSGKDNLRSAFKLQRTAEMHIGWHLKHTADLMRDLAKRRHFDRLILGGPKEAADELHKLLPRNLQAKVAGQLFLPVDVRDKELLDAIIGLENRIEREEEVKLVREFLMTDPANPQRALGLDATLMHLEKGRVHKLLYSENFKPQGSQCTGCGYLFPEGRILCGRCGSLINPISNFLDEIMRLVIRKEGSIEEVRGEAAHELDKVGGIGTILKSKEKTKEKRKEVSYKT